MPRWHTLSTYHLANHQAKTAHHVVVGHCPRSDTAFAVTANAIVDQHGSNRFCIRNILMLRAARKLWKIYGTVCTRNWLRVDANFVPRD